MPIAGWPGGRLLRYTGMEPNASQFGHKRFTHSAVCFPVIPGTEFLLVPGDFNAKIDPHVGPDA